MAESVDALVSNTSGATHPGSIPGLGTETEKVEKLSPFSFYIHIAHPPCIWTCTSTGKTTNTVPHHSIIQNKL